MLSTKLLTSLKTSGAISAYTNKTIQTMLHDIDRENVRSIVEFGPGEGGITREILHRLHPEGKLTCFELNKEDFEKKLNNIQDRRLTIHYISCEDINIYCPLGSVDCVISTIPLSLIGKSMVSKIFSNVYTAMKTGGTVISGNYTFWSEKIFLSIFHNVSRSYCLRNIPPVCIVTSIKK